MRKILFIPSRFWTIPVRWMVCLFGSYVQQLLGLQVLSATFSSVLQRITCPSECSKRSCNTPVSKTAQPVTCADYRHISVTPVLSKVMEWLTVFVRRDLYPVLVHPDFSNLFCDQLLLGLLGPPLLPSFFFSNHLSHICKTTSPFIL